MWRLSKWSCGISADGFIDHSTILSHFVQIIYIVHFKQFGYFQQGFERGL